MKLKRMVLGSIYFLLTTGIILNAQSNTTQYSTTTPRNLINAIPEWATYTIPAGVTLTGYYGCPASGTNPAQWSPPIQLSGTGEINWYGSGMVSELTTCPLGAGFGLGAIWVQEGTIAQIIEVNNTNITIPALPNPSPNQPICTGATLTQASDGTVTVVFPPACLLINGNFGVGTAGPYAIQIIGTANSALFKSGAGTNLAQ